MLESEQTLIPAFPRGPDAGASGLETVEGVLKALTTAHGASTVRVPALQHTPSLRRVTRHPAGNRAFRIAEHSPDQARAPVWESAFGTRTSPGREAPGNRFGGRATDGQ
jgi:hypothetical protein